MGRLRQAELVGYGVTTVSALYFARDAPTLWALCPANAKKFLRRLVVWTAGCGAAVRIAPDAARRILFPSATTVSAGCLVYLVAVAAARTGKVWIRARSLAKCARLLLLFGAPELILEAAADPESADMCALLAMLLGSVLGGKGAITANVVILLMLTGGEALEDLAFSRAQGSIASLIRQLEVADSAVVLRALKGSTLEEVEVAADSVAVGDTVVIRSGGRVPVDGVIINPPSGACATPEPDALTVDEHLLTGESGATARGVGDVMYSGTTVATGVAFLRARQVAQSSALALMRNELTAAMEQRRPSAMETMAQTASTLFTPFALALAAIGHKASRRRALRASMSRTPGGATLFAWETALAVLMAATPCPLSIGVPVSFLSGLSRAARLSVTIKSGTALEGLARATAVVLDKTGTLTTGHQSVSHFAAYCVGPDRETRGGAGPALPLACVAMLERASGSTHPVATALWRYFAAQEQPEPIIEVLSITSEPGMGVAGRLVVRGQGEVLGTDTPECVVWIAVGTERWLEKCGMAWARPPRGSGSHVFYGISVDTMHNVPVAPARRDEDLVPRAELLVPASASPRFCGEARVNDPVRTGAKEFVARLQSMRGVKVKLLSGDRSPVLQSVAKDLGIAASDVDCCLPAEKAAHVVALREAGHCVVMVGDGANDSAALAAADVGVSIGVNDLASSASDVVLSGREDSLETLIQLLAVARKTVRVASAGVKYGMSASVAQMVLASFGFLKPTTSAILQECVDLVTVGNAVRAL